MPRAAADLVSFLGGLDPPLAGEVREDTSLLRSGLLDSVALFRLLKWIEEALGQPVDPTAVDIVAEWDTPAAVEAFLLRARDGRP